MSLSKHALTFLKRHYHALLQRAYVLGLAATAERRFTLIPAPHSAQPAPAYRRRPKLTVPMLVAITALTCGPGLETAVARTTLTGNTISSGTYNKGLEINSPGSYTVDDDTKFQNVNEIDDAGALYLPTPAGNYGLTFAGTAEFSGNSAHTYGGAIYTQGNLTIAGGSGNITFSGNSAIYNGGAIYTQGNLTITGGSGNITFSGNYASNTGGAIYTQGNLTIIGGNGNITFSENSAGNTAGAIYTQEDLTIIGGNGNITFSGNSAIDKGRAIYTRGNLTITGGSGNITFSENSASIYGGAIYTQGNLTIEGGAGKISFSGNHSYLGGAIYSINGSINIRAGTGGIEFVNNHADRIGGAIYTGNVANITLTAAEGNITFSGNTAGSSNARNAIYINHDLFDSTINLQATENHEISFDDAISGLSPTGINVNLNQDDDYTGAIKFSTSMTLGQVTQHNGTFELSGTGTTLTSNYTLNQGTYEVKTGATGEHETFNYNGGDFKLNGTLDVTTFNQNGGDLKAGTGADDNLNLGTNGRIEVDDYQLKNGSLTLGDGADSLTITTFKLLAGGNFTVSAGDNAQYENFEMGGESLTVGANGSFTVTEKFTHNSGNIILESGSQFTQQKGDYTSHATELNLSAGSKFEVSAGSYTLADGATVKVSGLGSSITAQTIKLNSGSTLYFQLDQSVYDNKPENAMLKLNQTDNSAQAISLKDVTVTVDAATTTAAKRRAAHTGTTETVHLLHSNKGFTDIPADSAANNLYQVKVTDGETYRYGEDTTPDPDPDTGGTDPGQGGTNPGEGTTPPGSGGDGSGGDSLVAVRDPLGLARLGATGNQARAFTILENGTFAVGSPEERYFKAKGGIFEVTQQDGTAGLNALTALLPNDAPVVLDQVRHTISFITQAAFDSTELPQARLSATARGAVQDDSGRISAPLSLNSALWLKARLNNLESERYDSGVAGYEGDLSLLALGIDTALSDKWQLGFGFSYSKGDLDALSRSVESEGYSLFTYGRYRSDNWYLNGLVAVSLDDYDEDSQVLTQRTTADYRATTLYGGIFTGLELSTAHGGTFSPELGLTVLSTKLSDYDSDLSSDIEAERATISSALAGFKWQLQAISTEAAELTLQGSLHARYDLSTAGVDYTVGLSNGTQLQLTGEEPDRFAVMPSLGVSLKLGQSRALELEARYSAELSEHFTGQAVSLGLSYRF